MESDAEQQGDGDADAPVGHAGDLHRITRILAPVYK